VLAVAERQATAASEINESAIEKLVFLGFIGYSDPVRPSAKTALGELARAGVDVVMITGDHPSTATAIACELGLINERGVLTGAELDALDDDELCTKVPKVSVFARVTPTQKVRIVNAFKSTGRVVAMAGDGANDAPAIHLADVGIALGEKSTAAARNAADLVITDGRLETIGRAVIEGRALWRSVRDAAAILVGGNLGEIAFATTAGVLAGLSPLNARQLLLVNLITDTLPALALAVRRPRYATADELLREGPDVSLGKALQRDVALRAVLTAGAAGTAWLSSRVLRADRARSGTVALLALTGAQLAQTLATGGASPGVLAAGVGSMAVVFSIVETPGLSHFFGCRPLGPIGLFQAGAASAGAAALSVIMPRLAERRPRAQAQCGQASPELAPPKAKRARKQQPGLAAAVT
jgi:cation-transporting ATPase I